MKEEVHDGGCPPTHVGISFDERGQQERAERPAQETGERIASNRFEIARRDPLVDEGTKHRSELLDVAQSARCGPGGRNSRAGKEPLFVGNGEKGPVFLDASEHSSDAHLEPLAELLRVLSFGFQLGDEFLGPLLEQGAEYVVFVGEVVVDGAHRDSRARRDVLNAGAAKTALGKDQFGRVEDAASQERTRLGATSRQADGGAPEGCPLLPNRHR